MKLILFNIFRVKNKIRLCFFPRDPLSAFGAVPGGSTQGRPRQHKIRAFRSNGQIYSKKRRTESFLEGFRT